MTQLQNDVARDLKKAMSAAEFDEAARIGVRILRSHPKRTDIQIMTAVSELQGSNPAAAGARLRKLFRTVPTDHKLFGAIAQNLLQYSYIVNDFCSFESLIEQRLRAAPQDDFLAFMLGDVIFRGEVSTSPGKCIAPKFDRAVEVLKSISGHSHYFDEAQKLLARIHLHQERHDQAFELLEKAVDRAPENLDLQIFLASSYAMAGKVEQAVARSLSVLAKRPGYCAQPYVIISFVRPQAMPSDATARLDAILDDPTSGGAEKYGAAYALAKIAETGGDMQKAFDYYSKGHAANRAARPFDMDRELREMEALVELAHQGAADDISIADIAALDAKGPKPIFVLGMPRSGTTLTERILGAHSDVYAAGEIGDFAKAVIETVGTGSISQQLSRIDDKAARKIRKQYLDALRVYAPDKAFVTNKTPANFLRTEMIRRIFPDAPIIHTHRHPLATCLSIYTTPFAIPMRYSDDLGELADYYRAYVDLMNVFFETDRTGMLYDLSYEDLVTDPVAVAKDCLAHCGLDWHPGCLEFYKTDRTAATASMIQVRRPIFKDSLGKWQRFEPYIGALAKLADAGEDAKVNTARKSSRKAVAA
ncbi:sulfotransferase [Thalassospira profundimaris]|uniref:Uncharacterized protein n=1 Tax=Thalassospira profundimaris TaxID=502049 RepID=A0A367WJD8_9PROT|nr:sulfotransferase [Thalassospira profundimaris]RCK41538.1 hypothetical protein TH30_21660 [Thalassospira profundimaris]